MTLSYIADKYYELVHLTSIHMPPHFTGFQGSYVVHNMYPLNSMNVPHQA